MIFRRALQRELASSAGATFTVLFTVLVTWTLISVLGKAAGGKVASSDVLALIGFAILNYLPTILTLTTFISVLAAVTRSYRDVTSFPPLRQDIAVIVPEELAAGDVVAAVREAGGAELAAVRVFDVYRGPQVGQGRKSLALHLVFQAADRTLTDAEGDAARERIVARLADRFGAELRG